MSIIIKLPQEIAVMRQAGSILAAVLVVLADKVRVGMRTRDFDDIVAAELARRGARSAFKGYRGYPAQLCVSVNEEIVHGIPGSRVLKEGDIVSLDVGAIYDGLQADTAITVPVSEVSSRARDLIETTRGALEAGVAAARFGNRLGDISNAVQRYVESRRFAVIREYTGHGVRRELHEDPQIPNFGPSSQGPLLKPGMTLALEPMVSAGDWRTRLCSNRWTVVTADGSLAAHFEHTIAITEGQAEVLTALQPVGTGQV